MSINIKQRPKGSSMRIDYLTSDEEHQAVYGGKCQKLNAIVCALVGILAMITSFLQLRGDQLQIQNYLDPSPDLPYPDRPFPSVLLGCAAATTASSIVQIMASLMFIFEDVTLGVWKWSKFVVLMISCISVMLLMMENYGDIHFYKFYFTTLIINSILCALLLTGDVFCSRCSRNTNTARPY